MRKVKFEVRAYLDENQMMSKGIFIDNELFDWEIDEDSYQEAVKMGPKFEQAIQKDIAKHFLDSLSEFMNRKVTRKEVDLATKTGWIKK